MDVEVLFLKYAFPCTYVKLQRGKMDQSVFNRLEKSAHNGIKEKRSFLEDVYKPAFDRMKINANELDLDYWDEKVIKNYFMTRHNQFIDDGDGFYATASSTLKKLCKVLKAKIVEIKKGKYIVDYNFGTRVVNSEILPNCKVGEIVTIHHCYAIEKVLD